MSAPLVDGIEAAKGAAGAAESWDAVAGPGGVEDSPTAFAETGLWQFVPWQMVLLVEEAIAPRVEALDGKMSLEKTWVGSGWERSEKAATRLANPPINHMIENPECCRKPSRFIIELLMNALLPPARLYTAMRR
jgi:hypothetical protein